jgi:hypothetical protein
MYLGDNVPLYVLLVASVSLAFLALALIQPTSTATYIAKILRRGEYVDTDEIIFDFYSAGFNKLWRMLFNGATVALPLVGGSIYYFSITQSSKNVLMYSTIWIFAAFCVFDGIMFTFFTQPRLRDSRMRWAYFLFTNMCVMAYIIMNAILLVVFNDSPAAAVRSIALT